MHAVDLDGPAFLLFTHPHGDIGRVEQGSLQRLELRQLLFIEFFFAVASSTNTSDRSATTRQRSLAGARWAT